MRMPEVYWQSGAGWGAHIHRHVAPQGWAAALERVPAAQRESARAYLSDIAARMRVQRAIVRAAGFTTLAELQAARRRESTRP